MILFTKKLSVLEDFSFPAPEKVVRFGKPDLVAKV